MLGAPYDERQWADALDQYETVLRAQRQMLEAIDHGGIADAVPQFVPPATRTPAPTSMHSRIQRLMDETAALTWLALDLSRAARPVVPTANRFAISAPTVLDRVL